MSIRNKVSDSGSDTMHSGAPGQVSVLRDLDCRHLEYGDSPTATNVHGACSATGTRQLYQCPDTAGDSKSTRAASGGVFR